MSAQKPRSKSANMSDVNKQILAIKKKIQLSEGQRKALYEVHETETKENFDKIANLKKEIERLVLELREHRSTSAKCRVRSARLETVMGSLTEKSCSDTKELLDLKIIDKSKQLNVIRYRIRQKQTLLAKLASRYQLLLSKKGKIEIKKKVEIPIKIMCTELQNNIHAIKIQWREAEHVQERYDSIRNTLRNDAARFEFNINCAEDQLRIQKQEIKRLQKISEEAILMKGTVRSELLLQEKVALSAGKARDQQENEGKRLVVRGKQELEKLERRIFQSGKTPVRSEADTGDEIVVDEEVNDETTSQQEDVTTTDIFETLKQATGAVTAEEVVQRFKSQKETDIRLNSIRDSSEVKKQQLEKQQNNLTMEVERYKYAEAKDTEQNAENVDRIRTSIQTRKELTESYKIARVKAQEMIQSVCKSLNQIFCAIHPLANINSNPAEVLTSLKKELEEVMFEFKEVTIDKSFVPVLDTDDIDNQDWLPAPYSGLIRHTPIPEEESSTIQQPTVSEDEEEVPTRGYLKRQAQLVVDAKIRRKAIRVPRK